MAIQKIGAVITSYIVLVDLCCARHIQIRNSHAHKRKSHALYHCFLNSDKLKLYYSYICAHENHPCVVASLLPKDVHISSKVR